MNQHHLNYDQARLKLDHFHYEARVEALVQCCREQAENNQASPLAGFASRVGTLSRQVRRALHLNSA